MSAAPRRTCPACSRRYAGLIAPDCPICQGLGTLALGAAALAHYDTAAVARAIDLYLEHHAQTIRDQLPLGDRRQALEAATDNLRAAGVLHSTADASGTPARTPAPHDAASLRVTELDAYRVARTLGTPVTTRITTALTAPPIPLNQARPRNGAIPTASAMGHRSATHTIADPIDPLGPDTLDLEGTRAAHDHRARVIAAAVPTAAARRRRRQDPTP